MQRQGTPACSCLPCMLLATSLLQAVRLSSQASCHSSWPCVSMPYLLLVAGAAASRPLCRQPPLKFTGQLGTV